MVFLTGIAYAESKELNQRVQSKLSKLLREELNGADRLKKFKYILKTNKDKENEPPNICQVDSIKKSTLSYLTEASNLVT